MRATSVFWVMLQAVNVVADVLLDPGTVQDFITFEGVNSTAFPAANNVLVPLEPSSEEIIECDAGPLYAAVRISSCFTVSEIKQIDSWVQTKVAAESATMFSNSQSIEVSYYAELDSSGCANPTAWADVVNPYMKTTADMPNGASLSAVFSIAKGDAEFHSISGLTFSLRVGSSPSYEPIAEEKLFETVSGLVAGRVEGKTHRIPCASISGVAVPYNDNSGKAQCMCKCTSSYTLSGGSCVMNTVKTPSCTWNFGNGKCMWSSADKSGMTLIDCGADLLFPKDNYVSDGRINKHDNDVKLSKPMISIAIDSATSSAISWKQYVKEPKDTLASISFSSFNVYHPILTASDYKREASCSGCVAVVDDFSPEFVKSYTQGGIPTKDPTNPTLLSSESLEAAITAEASFIDAYVASNIINNGGNADRTLDVKEDTIVDFFEADEKKLSNTEYTSCFSDSIVSQMLSKSLLITPDALSVSNAKRMRCCSRKRTLVEEFYEYSCETNETPDRKTRSGESISFSHCMYVEATSLFVASAGIRPAANLENPSNVLIADGTAQERIISTGVRGYIHRTTLCVGDNAGAACAFTETLSDLFVLSASWRDAALGGISHGSDSAGKYVFWRYKVGISEWKLWSEEATATFDASNTAVYLEAWTQFGKVGDTFKFEFVLHASNEIATCSDFSSMWEKLTTNPLAHETSFCAYPGSDFVPLLFAFSGSIETTSVATNPSLKGVECSIKLANSRETLYEGELEAMFSQTIAQHQPLAKYFGVDLVSYPTTEPATFVEFQCSFLFSTDNAIEINKLCNERFELKDCSSPDLTSTLDICKSSQCKGALPGPGESCGGNVFIFRDGEGTKKKDVASPKCCDECSTPLSCAPILDIADMISGDLISRCEPTSNAALSGSATVLLVGYEASGFASLSGFVGTLIGSSIVVALAALLVFKRRAIAAQDTKTAECGNYDYVLLG